MTNRTLIMLVAVVVILAAAATAPMWWPTNDSDLDGSVVTKDDPLGLAKVDEDDVSMVTIARAGGAETVIVTRDGKGWKIGKAEADTKKIESFLESIEDAGDERAELVARTSSRHESLGVDDAAAATVTIAMKGRKDVILLVGRASNTPGFWYGRLPDSKKTWMLEGDVPTLLPADAKAWNKESVKGKKKPANSSSVPMEVAA